MIRKQTDTHSKFLVRVITNSQTSVYVAVGGLKRRDWLLIDQEVAEKITGQTDPKEQAFTFAIASVPAPEIEFELNFDIDRIEGSLRQCQSNEISKRQNWSEHATTILVVCGEYVVSFANGNLETMKRREFVNDDCPDEIIAAIETSWPKIDMTVCDPSDKTNNDHFRLPTCVGQISTPDIAPEM